MLCCCPAAGGTGDLPRRHHEEKTSYRNMAATSKGRKKLWSSKWTITENTEKVQRDLTESMFREAAYKPDPVPPVLSGATDQNSSKPEMFDPIHPVQTKCFP